jgi:hypothetical protein
VSISKTRVKAGLAALVLGTLAVLAAASAVAQERTLSTDPPRIDGASVVLLEKPTSRGNALVEIAMARDERLPSQVPISLERSSAVLRDDGEEGDRVRNDGVYSAIVPFDLEALQRNQDRVRELLNRYGRLSMPIYEGRARTRQVSLPEDFIRPLQPGNKIPLEWWGFDVAIQPEKSLLIQDVSVVRDPQRTYDPCANTGTPMGKWTFGHLMTQLANPAFTGFDPADFTRQWIDTLIAAPVVNGFDAGPQPWFQDPVLDKWPKTPAGKLDLAKAPFKLLAIVNRVDLRKNAVYGGGDAGEARFVFGLARCGPNGSTTVTVPLTVILEYGVQKSGCAQVRSWGKQWAALSDLPLGSSQYNAALEAITDQFSLAGAAPVRPNQSALNQLRTNGGPADSLWQFREIKLMGKGAVVSQLLPTTVAQTPDSDVMPEYAAFFSYPNPNALADFVNLHEASILAGKHVVPLVFAGLPFRGASSTRHGVVFGWHSPLITNPEARHKFALQTCNGCHLEETNTSNFFHISPNTAALSGFMTGIDAGGHHFDELERRAVDLDGLVNGQCLNMLDTKRLLPTSFAH